MRLDVKNLSFTYGTHKVLDDVSFSLKGGQLVTILGKNGAGKTTLFKSLLGLLPHQSGEVFIDDKDLFKLQIKDKAKLIAYIPQESRQIFAYTVEDAVLMGCTPNVSTLSSPKEKERMAVKEVLKELGIEHLKNRDVNAISGGERQLVLCARALLASASTLVFDEPTASLDLGNQIKVLKTISSLTKKGYLAIVSTHNLEQALNFSNRIIMIEHGKILFNGTSEELLGTNILSTFYNIDISVKKYDSWYVVIPEN